MNKKCYLVLYLHMHQPFYKNLRTGRYDLPWVRLHALRNYADIPNLQRQYPEIRITYNIVPSLIEQILDYASGAEDSFAEVSRKPAEELTEDDKKFLLSNFFQLNTATQIDPLHRYRQLLELKGSRDRTVSKRALDRFGPGELRDLQVLFSLAWSGWMLRERPEINDLLRKGRNFSEREKQDLLKAQREHLSDVLEPYKWLVENGRCELSTSPYYHPILPLLCDTNVAREAVPDVELPAKQFRHPEDAAYQIESGISLHRRIFGRAPAGMWPSEGSLSEQACSLMTEKGIRWAASDRNVLAHSIGAAHDALKPEDLYTPYFFATEHGKLALFFRDSELSDLPAFVYHSWPPERAVGDFLSRLEKIAEGKTRHRTPVVSVILDGENAWAAYPDNGREFFENLFDGLQSREWLETVTPSQVLEAEDVQPPTLPRIVAGSWIYGNLTTWIGHSEKNRAWEILAEARDRLTVSQKGDSGNAKTGKAFRSMMIAEGSDWFWWYGDDHVSAYAVEFDLMFREHVRNIYISLGEEPPAYLEEPIKRSGAMSDIKPPLRLISPVIDGRVGSYQEWANAGCYRYAGGEAMQHRTTSIIEAVYFGFDVENAYFRFDGREPFNKKLLDGYVLRVYITAPIEAMIRYRFGKDSSAVLEYEGRRFDTVHIAVDSIIELALPLSLMGTVDFLSFHTIIESEGNELERHPPHSSIKIDFPGDNLDEVLWTT